MGRMRLFFACALLLLACEKPVSREREPSNSSLMRSDDTPSKNDPHQAGSDPHASAADPHAAPSPHGNAAAPSEKSAPSGPASAGGLTWEAPAPFERRAPKSSMRAAEYGLAGEPSAELGVFYFGADQGGSIEANMTRWVGQFSQADGSATKPVRSERKVHGIEVALIEARGAYSGGMAMPGAPAPAAISDAMLLGAIAKGPGGAVFFKLVGPRAALESARGAFDALVGSLQSSEAK